MTLHVLETPELVADAAARRFVELAPTHVGLAGGSTPARLYRILRHLDLRPVEWWFGDDRWVPADHEQSNEGMARRELLDPIGATAVHPMYKGESPQADAAAYERELGDTVLDLLLVGLGDDGHTLSIFPRHDDWPNATGRVAATKAPANWPDRVTLLPAYARTAREIHFLVTGEAKADALEKLLAPSGDERETPARALRGDNVRVFCDVPAAARLSG